MSVVLARLSLRRGHKRKPCTKKDAPAEWRVTWRKTIYKAQECGQSYVLYFCWSQDNAGAHFKISRRARVRGRVRSINAHAEQKKRFKLRWTGHFAKIEEPYCGCNGQWGIANKRGSTSIGSRSWSLRDSAITRRNACCSILWKTLRRPRIFLRVGQRSKTTVEQRGEDNVLRNGQFRTSCCSRVVRHSW